MTVVVGGFVWFLYAYGGHDRIDLIDKPETVKALAPTCDVVGAAASSIPVGGSARTRAAALEAYSAAAHDIPSTVAGRSTDQLESDQPTEEWGADWEALLVQLDGYTEGLSTGGSAVFEIPSTPDGFSILGRMNFASPLKGCDVPAAIAVLDDDPPRLPPGLPPRPP